MMAIKCSLDRPAVSVRRDYRTTVGEVAENSEHNRHDQPPTVRGQQRERRHSRAEEARRETNTDIQLVALIVDDRCHLLVEQRVQPWPGHHGVKSVVTAGSPLGGTQDVAKRGRENELLGWVLVSQVPLRQLNGTGARPGGRFGAHVSRPLVHRRHARLGAACGTR